MPRACHYPPSVLGYCDGPTDMPHWCGRITDEDREHADAMDIAARDDWAEPWWGRLVFEFDADNYTLAIRTMHPIPDDTEQDTDIMTSQNNQAPHKMSPWGAVALIAVLALIVLAFVAGLVAIIKWA